MALRYIAGSGHCSVKISSQLVGEMLACVDNSIRELNDRLLLETGVRRYFIIRDGFEVSDFLASWTRTGHRSRDTFGFATLYTILPLKHLTERVEKVTMEGRDLLGEAKY